MTKRVLLLGATGTIGRATLPALQAQGHEVHVVTRSRNPVLNADQVLDCDIASLEQHLKPGTYDAIVSCIASRTGAPKDAWAVDYGLNAAALRAAKAAEIEHFVLLSAICVQKPKLPFQKAKLAFERELQASGLTYSIVRPTAFFKSLSGQIDRLRKGKPFLIFGDGDLTACKPISDKDLAQYLTNCLTEPKLQNKVLPIGGPGPAMTAKDQGQALFEALDLEPRFKQVPVRLLDVIIAVLGALGRVAPALAAKAELARIGRYYATESMLVWNEDHAQYDADATPEFGSDTLAEHYAKAARGEREDDRGAHAVF